LGRRTFWFCKVAWSCWSWFITKDGNAPKETVIIVLTSIIAPTKNQLICIAIHPTINHTIDLTSCQADSSLSIKYLRIVHKNKNPSKKLAKFLEIFRNLNKDWSRLINSPYTRSLVRSFHASAASKTHNHDNIPIIRCATFPRVWAMSESPQAA